MSKIQTGIRIDKKLLKVFKGLAEKREQSLAGLIEEVLARSLLGLPPLHSEDLSTIEKLNEIYCLDRPELESLIGKKEDL